MRQERPTPQYPTVISDFPVAGTRHTLLDAPVAPNAWHPLRVEFAGPRIAVILDGKRYIEFTDTHIVGGGSVGVWTKAHSVTVFNEFSSAPPLRLRDKRKPRMNFS